MPYKKFVVLFSTALLISCAKDDPFQGNDGCLLVVDTHTGHVEKVWNEARCRMRFPACSTFKVPLAVMAFDAGVLRDEKQKLQWDGKPRMLATWNRDHDAASWLRDSVVWFSQRLTPQLGEVRIARYLHEFHYGNGDIGAGLLDAWLKGPDAQGRALKINAHEQVDFMRNLLQAKLPVKKFAIETTRKIIFLEKSQQGFLLSGKTGSNWHADGKRRFGWFVGSLARGEQEYVVVANYSDREPPTDKRYGGAVARDYVKAYLARHGLW